MKQLLVGVKEASHTLSVGRTKIFGLLTTGELQRVKIGRRTLITKESVERLAGVLS